MQSCIWQQADPLVNNTSALQMTASVKHPLILQCTCDTTSAQLCMHVHHIAAYESLHDGHLAGWASWCELGAVLSVPVSQSGGVTNCNVSWMTLHLSRRSEWVVADKEGLAFTYWQHKAYCQVMTKNQRHQLQGLSIADQPDLHINLQACMLCNPTSMLCCLLTVV